MKCSKKPVKQYKKVDVWVKKDGACEEEKRVEGEEEKIGKRAAKNVEEEGVSVVAEGGKNKEKIEEARKL
ncbi:hypothetical protein FRX31_024774 [Thalictrum thalictroides]|uniref:Uncharacterized protein n=1 Tax=Thalictrum thalictroides TaxID=46969 RepID=A0A7J6VLN5_THATH|nr:hypothetical protein FRX31_024774 [Thalictrum thalictroides]